MRKTVLPILFIGLVLLSGCKKEYSRYPSVVVPQYTEAEYAQMLFDKNPEVVYDAIAVLCQQADAMGKLLSDDKADKKSAEYTAALDVYKKISGLLNAEDHRVVAASLRFVQLFAETYTAKAELVQPVLQINSKNTQVVYEQIMALSVLVNKDSKIPDSVVRNFLKHRSWVVSRAAYLLVNSLGNDRIRGELVKTYRLSGDEKEKLLILTAFQDKTSDSLVDALGAEILKENSAKIRYQIYDVLRNSRNQEKVLLWFYLNYDKLDAADKVYLFESHLATMQEDFSSRLIIQFVKKGFPANEAALTKINDALDVYERKTALSPVEKQAMNNLQVIAKALQDDKKLSEPWKKLRNRTKVLNTDTAKLQSDYDILTKDFAAKTAELFTKYAVSAEKKQKYIEAILHSREGLRELLK